MTTDNPLPAFCAFEAQLKTLCLKEFPCGIGTWRENHTKKKAVLEKDKISSKFTVTLKDYGSQHVKTESLDELLSTKRSPWNQDYSWSKEARELREIAVKSPWLIDEGFVLAHFKTLRIVDKGVSEVDSNFLKFPNLHELTLTANKLRTLNSENLPPSLKVLEVCANQISNLADLCIKPPPLIHLGLGHNLLTMVDDYITGEYWPCLLSLDLSHNNLGDLMDMVRKLQTLPKLRNLLLHGNPLSLVPGYRGFVIDNLRNLDILDDISISADEKHHYKGLARRREYILDEAKVHLHIDYIKGVLEPEELKNPEDLPEFPIITRNYYVQFMFLEDRSANAEILQLLHDDQFTEMDGQTDAGQTLNTARESGIVLSTDAGQPSQRSLGQKSQGQRSEVMRSQLTGAISDGNNEAEGSNTQRSQSVPPESEVQLGGALTKSHNSLGTEIGSEASISGPVLQLAAIKSASSTWMEEMELNWHQVQTRDDLLSLRDFCIQGMDIKVMEEKILSYPADQVQDGVLTPQAKDKGKADKKKDDGKKGKKATPTPSKKTPTPKKKEEVKKKKKKGEPDIDLVHMPAEYSELADFHIPLEGFLDGEYQFENVFMKSWDEGSGHVSRMSEISVMSKDKKDKKKTDKKKDAKDSRKSPKVEKKLGDKHDKGKGKAAEAGDDEPPPPPPPLQVHVKVKLHHWRTAMDLVKDEQESSQQAEGSQGQ